MEEEWEIEPLEEEMEGGLEEMEENEEEDESDFELEDLEEEEEHLLEEVEEEKETVEDDESEQEVAAMVAGHRDPLEQFGPVFWGLVHSLLRSLSYDDHVLVWPPDTRLMVRHSSQPLSGPGEGPAPPQEQEDLGEGGKASQEEASDYQYEESDEEVQEAEGEEDSNEKPEEGPEKDLDPAEDSLGEPSCQA
nr:proline-, glutamic acid- and leucine-rich protein 1-like [Odocoileus virginianus texanus]